MMDQLCTLREMGAEKILAHTYQHVEHWKFKGWPIQGGETKLWWTFLICLAAKEVVSEQVFSKGIEILEALLSGDGKDRLVSIRIHWKARDSEKDKNPIQTFAHAREVCDDFLK